MSSLPPPDSLEDRARHAIHSSGMAQREVARRMDLDETKLSKALNGARKFSPDELIGLATVTGVTVEWLMAGHTSGVESANAAILPTRHEESPEQALNRRNIVESAWWLFADHGYDGVRIKDIAEAAGMSTALVHYYFDGKKEIFTEVLRYSVKLASDRQRAELSALEDPLERLRRLVRLQLPVGRKGVAEWSIWLQVWTSVTVTGARQHEHVGSYQRWWTTVRDIVADGQEQEIFRSEPVEDMVNTLTAFIDGLGIRVLTGMLTADEMAQQIDTYIDRNLALKPST